MSILFAVCFLLGFLTLNFFSFQQNNHRLSLVETINREALPTKLSSIQIVLNSLEKIFDSEEDNIDAQKQKFANLFDILKDKLLDLQNNQLAVIATPEISQHFVGIYGTLDGLDDFINKKDIRDERNKTKIREYLSHAADHFDAIDIFSQKYHQMKVDDIIGELRAEEKRLLAITAVFVVLGTMMIIFLLVDLFRRGDLLERASQAERLKNSFFAMMSHEIRTPINGILGTVRLMQDSELNSHQQHLAEIVRTSAESLVEIVNDVLDYSKIEAGKLELQYEDYELRKLVENVFDLVQPLTAEKKLKLDYHIAENIPAKLHSDPSRVRQIIINFMSNAIKFTEKGSVQLYISSENLPNNPTTYIRFDVVDTGMGISDEAKSRLFREFSQVDGSYTRRFAGTGLGLAICRRLAEMMQGFIGVNSEIGKGSTFWFSVPLVAATQQEEEKQDTATILTNHVGTILLAEDNPTNQMIAEAFLRQGGHLVHIVDNGKIALEAIKHTNYDIIFMDIAMPEMDGFTATKAIRALKEPLKSLPIIAMTAHAMRGDREECLAAGMDDYITKPLSREALLQMAQKWIITRREVLATMPAPETKTETTEPAASQTPAPAAPVHQLTQDETDESEISDLHFNQLLNDLGAESLGTFALMFFDDLQNTSGTMLDAANKGDWANAKTHAHSLKSSTLSFGLIRLSRLAQKIEQQCKTDGKADPALLLQWPEKMATAVGALREHLKAHHIAMMD